MDMVGNPNVPVVLVGNKSDLHAEREVSREEVRQPSENKLYGIGGGGEGGIVVTCKRNFLAHGEKR